MAIPMATTPATLSEQLKCAFIHTFARTEHIFNILSPQAYYERPISLRHPINFYEGHLAAFIWNTLFRRILGEPSFQPDFDRLFARGIDPETQHAANSASIHQWPTREAVQQYKRIISERLFAFLDEIDFEKPEHPLLQGGEVLFLLLEHEQMHQETLLYMLHQLPHHLKQKPEGYQPAPTTTAAPQPRMVQIPAGQTLLGALPGTCDFAWDNEKLAYTLEVENFSMDVHNITNGQFLEFIEAGGYQNPSYWTPEAWKWVQETQRTHPEFWHLEKAHNWQWRGFFEEHALPLSWPVYVTQAEAAAYAKFLGKSLPTEAQWQRAAFGDDVSRNYPWGNDTPIPEQHGNFHFNYWSPVPVGNYPEGASIYGIQDMLGNGWEWTATPFMPFEGFQASAGYPQYSSDFFDGQHLVLKGASCFTDARLLRRSLRNWYYWHYPYMYATFRCVQS